MSGNASATTAGDADRYSRRAVTVTGPAASGGNTPASATFPAPFGGMVFFLTT